MKSDRLRFWVVPETILDTHFLNFVGQWLGSGFLLVAVGVLSLLGYTFATFGLEFYSGTTQVANFLGLWVLLFGFFALAILVVQARQRAGLKPDLLLIMGFAAGFRLVMLFAGLPQDHPFEAASIDLGGEAVVYQRFLIYDHDVWRYLWDGHVAASGANPYSVSPEGWWARAQAGDPLGMSLFAGEPWEDIFDQLGYADHLTVYPPLAQAFFRLSHAIAPASVLLIKLMIATMDLVVCWLLLLGLKHLGRSPAEVLLYAWNPLIIKEFSGSGHLDPLMLLFLLAAVLFTPKKHHRLGILSFGLAVLAKLSPIILAPFFLRRWPMRWWGLVAVPLVLGYGYYASQWLALWRGLGTFASDWVFNPGPWALIQQLVTMLALPQTMTSVLAGLLILFWVFVCWRRDRGDDASLVAMSFLVVACALLLSPAVMPWYLSWALVLGVLAGNRSWLLLTFLALGSYLIYIDGQVRVWWLWLEYGLFFAAIAYFRMRKPKEFLANGLGS